MPVHRYLDLSTSHLTRIENRDGLPRVIPHEYGAWVHASTITEDSDLEDHTALAKTRPNLAACIAKAREYDCYWINFDADAEQDDSLPTFEW
jgi:hypothetical protein